MRGRVAGGKFGVTNGRRSGRIHRTRSQCGSQPPRIVNGKTQQNKRVIVFSHREPPLSPEVQQLLSTIRRRLPGDRPAASLFTTGLETSAQCSGGMPSCKPCLSWAFHRFLFENPSAARTADFFQGLVFGLGQRQPHEQRATRQMPVKIRNVPPGLPNAVLNQSRTTGKTLTVT